MQGKKLTGLVVIVDQHGCEKSPKKAESDLQVLESNIEFDEYSFWELQKNIALSPQILVVMAEETNMPNLDQDLMELIGLIKEHMALYSKELM